MVPAQECFGAHDARGVRRHDGLVHDRQLTRRERALEFRGECDALARIAAHVLGEQLAASATPALGSVHRGVGVAQQGDGGIGWRLVGEECGCRERDPDARRGDDLHALQDHLTGHRLAHALGDVHRHVFVTQSVAQHDELVPANACDEVGRSRGGCDALGDGGDQLVAHAVADRVVDVLELVEVDEQHGHAALGGHAALERFAQLAHEQYAIRQSGECVVRGLAAEFVLQLLGLGHVASDGGVVRHTAVGCTHDLQHDRHRSHDAVWATEGEFALPAIRRRRRDDLARDLVANRLDEQLCCRIGMRCSVGDADQAARAVVAELQVTDRVEHDDGVLRGVQDADETFAQHSLGDRLGDVGCRAHEADDLAALDDRLGRHVHPDRRAVVGGELELV